MRMLVVSLVILSLVGCTSMQPIDVPQAPGAPALHVGDNARIVGRDGKVYRIEITEVDRDGVRGKNDRGEGQLRYADMQSIQVEKVSWWKVGGWSVAAIASLWITVVALGIYAFSHAF